MSDKPFNVRPWILLLNSATALFFVGFFAYTFVLRDHVVRLARDFVTDKTQRIADPLVDLAEGALRLKAVRQLLRPEQLVEFETEIAEYRKNPREYIGILTGRRLPALVPKVNNPLVARITEWKEKVRAYYDKVLARLVLDLRIFAGSNLLASSAAAVLVLVSRRRRFAWLSLLLIAAVVYCVSLYVDQLTFFRILFNLYMGWWYPLLLLLTFVGLWLDNRAPGEDPPSADAEALATSATSGAADDPR